MIRMIRMILFKMMTIMAIIIMMILSVKNKMKQSRAKLISEQNLQWPDPGSWTLDAGFLKSVSWVRIIAGAVISYIIRE